MGDPCLRARVDNDPLAAVKDAIAMEEPDELVVSTHPEDKSGWRPATFRGNPEGVAIVGEHVVGRRLARSAQNILVVANETVLGAAARPDPREGARRRPRDELPDHLAAERS
jgi:hypothetical protein